MSDDTERRLTDLEVKVAFQEHLLAELDEVIQELRGQVELLQADLRALREQHELGPEDPDQRPPHY